MKIYFVAEFDLILEYDCNSFYMKRRDIIFCEDFYSGKFKIKPLKDCDELIEYELILDSCLKCKNNKKIQILKLGINKYLIVLKPYICFSPLTLETKMIKYCNYTYQINLYNQDYGLVQIFTPNGKFFKYLDCVCESFDYEIKTICGKDILFIKYCIKYQNYYFIFSDEQLLFEGYVKEININSEHLLVLKDDINCYGQKTVYDFNLKDHSNERYLIYFDKREVCKSINVLYLFMDAIKIQNYDFCVSLLAKNLTDLDKDCLFEFFGEFDDYYFIEEICVLEKNNEVTKVVYFEVLNNMIHNIND